MICLLLCALCQACSSDVLPETQGEEFNDYMQFRFSIDMGEMSATRSGWTAEDESKPWSDDYTSSDALYWESVISSISILAYDNATGNYVGQLTDMVQTGTLSFTSHFKMSGGTLATVDKLQGRSLRFYVYINYNIQNPPTIQSDLCSLNFQWLNRNSSTGFRTYGSGYMPMWGVKKVEIPTATGGQSLDIGNIQTLRSLTKVEVTIDSSDPNDVIDYVKLVGRVACQCYVTPQYKDGDSYIALTTGSTEDIKRYYTTFNVGSLTDYSATDLKFKPTGNGGYTAIMYLPEQLIADNSTKLVLSINGEEFDPLYFCNYDADGNATTDYFNLLRNHHYQYRVKVLKGKLMIVVEDWEAVFKYDYDFENEP